jgi:hypothetical protein
MAQILDNDDFENGPFTIPLNGEEEIDLPIIIEEVEREYLSCLFGKDLYILFKADVDANAGVPVIPRFVKVFNEFLEQPNSILYDSKGIKEMLKAFVYYEYIKSLPTRATTIGIKRTQGENSENVSAIAHDITIKYNRAITTYCTIQWWMGDEDSENYEEYEGIPKKFNHPY